MKPKEPSNSDALFSCSISQVISFLPKAIEKAIPQYLFATKIHSPPWKPSNLKDLLFNFKQFPCHCYINGNVSNCWKRPIFIKRARYISQCILHRLVLDHTLILSNGGNLWKGKCMFKLKVMLLGLFIKFIFGFRN